MDWPISPTDRSFLKYSGYICFKLTSICELAGISDKEGLSWLRQSAIPGSHVSGYVTARREDFEVFFNALSEAKSKKMKGAKKRALCLSRIYKRQKESYYSFANNNPYITVAKAISVDEPDKYEFNR